jgi:type-F conjugative transfer system pilin assembly protein TrbC
LEEAQLLPLGKALSKNHWTLLLVVIIELLFLPNAMASDLQEEIESMVNQAEERKLEFMSEALALRDQIMNKTFNNNNYNFKLEELIPSEQHGGCSSCSSPKSEEVDVKKEIDQKYLVFVSFSMPPTALKSLYLAANNNGGVLLLRGLKNGSFKETAAYLKSLEIGVDVNPEAFKKYNVDRVPTIVLVGDNNFQAISGNVSFQYAKEKLLEAIR